MNAGRIFYFYSSVQTPTWTLSVLLAVDLLFLELDMLSGKSPNLKKWKKEMWEAAGIPEQLPRGRRMPGRAGSLT